MIMFNVYMTALLCFDGYTRAAITDSCYWNLASLYNAFHVQKYFLLYKGGLKRNQKVEKRLSWRALIGYHPGKKNFVRQQTTENHALFYPEKTGKHPSKVLLLQLIYLQYFIHFFQIVISGMQSKVIATFSWRLTTVL